MTTAVANVEAPAKPKRRGRGRVTRLTPEVHKTLVTAIGAGAPIKTACFAAGIAVGIYCEWVQRGRGEHPTRPWRKIYADLAEAVERAKARGDLELIDSVRRSVRGRKCATCGTKGSIANAEGNRVRCPACAGDGMAIRPDGRLALKVLACRHEEFREPREAKVTVEAQVEVSGHVEIEVRATALTLDLAAMSPEQLAALAGVAEVPDLIDVEEA